MVKNRDIGVRYFHIYVVYVRSGRGRCQKIKNVSFYAKKCSKQVFTQYITYINVYKYIFPVKTHIETHIFHFFDNALSQTLHELHICGDIQPHFFFALFFTIYALINYYKSCFSSYLLGYLDHVVHPEMILFFRSHVTLKFLYHIISESTLEVLGSTLVDTPSRTMWLNNCAPRYRYDR